MTEVSQLQRPVITEYPVKLPEIVAQKIANDFQKSTGVPSQIVIDYMVEIGKWKIVEGVTNADQL